MDFVTAQTYLGDILHIISQALLAPDIVFLLFCILYGIWSIGSVVLEYVTERRNFKAEMPKLLAALNAADDRQIPDVICKSGLLNRQKHDLLTVYDYRMLPDDSLIALVKRLIAEQDNYFDRIVGRNSTVAKVAPMLGLMGTLIPLGPGIAALGTGEIQKLSSSIVIAFDTTVAGLVVAAVCVVIAKIRRNWYEDYMAAFESAMATIVQKIDTLQKQGRISATQPEAYAEAYKKAVKEHGAMRMPGKGSNTAPSASAQAQASQQQLRQARANQQGAQVHSQLPQAQYGTSTFNGRS